MRDDMSQVLVDEPRSGRSFARTIAGTRRQRRNRLDPDGESAPQRLGMRSDGGRSKWFGEHLGPLYRYLRGQANRPWSKVHGELCAALDRRSVVQAHLFQHIGDVVAVDTEWRDGQVWARNRWRQWRPLAEDGSEMYVHPRTGLLLVNRAREREARRREAAAAARARAAEAERRIGLPHLGPDRQWHRVDGLWYEVTLARLDPADPGRKVYDVLLQRAVGPDQRALLRERYGAAHSQCYAASKRQLDGRTLRRHGLGNVPAA